jgi:hypothetical protein
MKRIVTGFLELWQKSVGVLIDWYFIKHFSLIFVVGIIDYNFLCFREAIQQVFELRNKSQVFVALSTNHHSNILSNQNTTVNSETQNTTLNSATVQR